MNNKRSIIIVGAVLIVVILSLFIPTIKQGKDLTSSENDREEVLYEGNTEDTGSSADTTSAETTNK